MKPLLMVILVGAVCAAPTIRWRFNAPRLSWTKQELTHYPSPARGYAGNVTDPHVGKLYDGVYRPREGR
jgi:hypothetical protein